MAQNFTTNFTYDVFFSFRGEDTRYNFTGNLNEVCGIRGIKTFFDDRELKGGDKLSTSLSTAIEKSRMFVIVFSENYASSTWCLDELVKILQCAEQNSRRIWPIFYKVDPSDIRHQRNSYHNAMIKHEELFGKDSQKVLNWRSALTEVANFKGYPLTGKEYEWKCIGDIVREFSRLLPKGKYIMGRKRDKFWEYVDRENKCIFCGQKIPGAFRIKYHLAQIPGGGINKCDKVEDDVKAEAISALNNSNKRRKQSTASNDVEENNMNANLASSSTRGEIEVDLLPTTDLVGEEFQWHFDEIWEWLVRDEVDVSIMGVWGMGGVGKTALLKNVHNELLNHNRHAIWIAVSQNHNIRRLQRVIAKSIDENIWDEDDDEVKTAARLSRAFRKMKECVVFLDDVWYDISLEDVGIPLRNDGIRIIVASRLLDVCKRMGCKDNIVRVQPLDFDEAFDLFSKSLGDDVTLTKGIAKDLTKKCGGLPLAIIAIARSMRGKTDIREWTTTLSKLKRIEMDQDDIKRCVFPVLNSSYDRLNDTTLQDCFLTLPLYFENFWMEREDLIRNFVDEGLIDERQGIEAQFDEGHSILNKLINNSLLRADEDYHSVWLHRLVEAMAINIGEESRGYMGKANLPDEREWREDLQKISLIVNKIAEIPFDMPPKCPKLSTLRMIGGFSSNLKVIPDNFFMNMPALRILDLSRNQSIEGLPVSISNLECLTVLLLYWCKSLRHIPSLAKLRQLRRLNLSETAITEVPLGFENLTNLRWLRLDGTAVVKVQYLEKLPMLESIGATFVDKDEFNACIQIIQNRINSGMMTGYFVRLVGDKISVRNDYDSLYDIDVDKTIEIEDVEHSELLLPTGDIDALIIKSCNQWRSLCDALSIQQDNSLHISKCGVLSCNKLEHLFCSSLDCILCSSFQFSHLTHLIICGCDGMKKLLTPGMSTQLHNLEEIVVVECESMEEIFSMEGLWVPVGIEINLPNLKSVLLSDLPQLRSVSKGIMVCSSLKKFSIVNCPILQGPPQIQPPFEIQVA